MFIRFCILTLCQVKFMNDKIQDIIQEIRNKKKALSDLLINEKQKVLALETELAELKREAETTTNQLNQLQKENSDLQTLLEETKAQVNVAKEPANVGYEHIDEMVREIEYCIGQLKNNA